MDYKWAKSPYKIISYGLSWEGEGCGPYGAQKPGLLKVESFHFLHIENGIKVFHG